MATQILLIQNDPTGAKEVRGALTSPGGGVFEIEWVRTCAEGVERLYALDKQELRAPDSTAAVLVDLNLPDGQGMEAFDRLFAAAPRIPFLILCSAEEEEASRLIVQRGAQDYLLKERLDAYWLPKALSGMIDRAFNAEAMFGEKERAEVTLNSIGDAVVSTDIANKVTYLNSVAEQLTGWAREDAIGRGLDEVFPLRDATTREPIQNPMALAIQQNKVVALAANCVLVRRDGVEAAIEDSAAPIHDRRGHVTGAVMVFHDVSSARAISQKMAHLAQHDSLTDLPNRILFNDRLSHSIAAAQRHGKQLALLYLDVDRFKHVNDSLGHAVGDRLLQSVGKRLNDCVRASDTVSRQGGDEFAVLLSEITHPTSAGGCAEKILRAVNEPHRIDAHDIHVTASLGIVLYPADGRDPETLLKNADFAMYQAKDGGRNNYQYYSSDLNVSAAERQGLEVGLRHAATRGELELHYQPKVKLDTRAIVGVEALLRWHHPARGLLSPHAFVGIAEDTGLIVPIGRWVLRESCRQAQAWVAAGLPPVKLAVNVSAVELRAKDFVAEVQVILSETGFDPTCLELEITETFLMQESTSTSETLTALKKLGMHLALDDFGTGYSSLSFVKRFPIDTLKVDQSFVRDVISDEDDASIVRAVIDMGRSLRKRVIAEGVETREQLDFLVDYGCPEAQGFYFSRPLQADKFAKLLTDGIPRHKQSSFAAERANVR